MKINHSQASNSHENTVTQMQPSQAYYKQHTTSSEINSYSHRLTSSADMISHRNTHTYSNTLKINSTLGDSQLTNKNQHSDFIYPHCDIPQRPFMDCLLKHTAIALAIIIPLAAYSAFATSATPVNNRHLTSHGTGAIHDSYYDNSTNLTQHNYVLDTPVYDENFEIELNQDFNARGEQANDVANKNNDNIITNINNQHFVNHTVNK